MNNFCIQLLALVVVFFSVSNARSVTLLTSKNPVSLNLNHSSSMREFRSKPALFCSALSLCPNTPFSFDYFAWQNLKSCGLFKNLGASVKKDKEGRAYVDIVGDELPSLTIAPHVAVEVLDKPDISGGIDIRDRNFMGLGQTLDIAVFKQDVIEGQTSLPVSWKMMWKEFPAIRNWRSSLSCSNGYHLGLPLSIDRSSRSKKIPFNVQELMYMGSNKMGYTEVYRKEISPIDGSNYSVPCDGIRSNLCWESKIGSFAFTPNIGKTKIDRIWQPFTALDCTFRFPKLILPIPLPSCSRLGLKAHNSLFSSLNLHIFKSWGKGRIPYLHGISLGDKHHVRGSSRQREIVDEFIGLQISPGILIDIAGVKLADSNQKDLLVSMGGSLRFKGLRVDVASSIFKWNPRLLIGIDTMSV